MKRFLSVLVASMFLASTAFAGEAMKEEKKAEKGTAGVKGAAGVKGEKGAAGVKGAKGADTKAGAMGDEKKSDTATVKTDDKAKVDDKKASK